MSDHEITICLVLQNALPLKCEQRGIIPEQALELPVPLNQHWQVGSGQLHPAALAVATTSPAHPDCN